MGLPLYFDQGKVDGMYSLLQALFDTDKWAIKNSFVQVDVPMAASY